MDTERLRTIQQPSQVEALLESFVASVDVLPDSARKLADLNELSLVLRQLAITAGEKDKVWGAWTDNHRTWLFTAELSLALSREHGRPALQVDMYGEHGQLTDSSNWLSARDGQWRRCAE